MTTDGVDFIDEDDAGGVLLALLEQVAHAAGAHADEHFHEVGTGDGEERHVGFAGDGAGQQGLAGSGRTHQQHALGNAPAEFLELLRLAQELDDLLQFFLGFLNAGDVLEGHLLLLRGVQARAALAEAEGLVAAALHLPHHENPEAQQQHEGDGVDQDGNPVPAGLFLIRHVDALGEHLVHQRLVGARRDDGVQLFGGVLVVALQLGAGDADRLDPALIDLAHQIGEREVRRTRSVVLPNHRPQHHHHHDDDQPQDQCLHIRIHFFSCAPAAPRQAPTSIRRQRTRPRFMEPEYSSHK